MCHHGALLTLSGVILSLANPVRRRGQSPVTQETLAMFFTVTEQVNGRAGFALALADSRGRPSLDLSNGGTQTGRVKDVPRFPCCSPLACSPSLCLSKGSVCCIFIIHCSFQIHLTALGKSESGHNIRFIWTALYK